LEFTSAGSYLRKDQVEFHLNSKMQQKNDSDSSFYAYAKQWWNDFLQIRASHSTRLVKIFSNNELGKRSLVTANIYPIISNEFMTVGRDVETPRHAARLVSLIDNIPLTEIGEHRYLYI
jgi:centrosomal protein CEP76